MQKCRVYPPHGDGTYLQKDLAAWKASWNVFGSACLLLNVCSITSLEAYARQIEKLNTQWPHCWGLVYTAEDSARAERLDKLPRRFTTDAGQGRQVFDPGRAFSYGQRTVNTGLRRCSSPQQRGRLQEHETTVPGTHGRRTQANRDRRQAAKRRLQLDREELARQRSSASSQQKGNQSQKGKAKGKGKDRSGQEICFSWASGREARAQMQDLLVTLS